jgi:hypothetical protein
MADHACTAPATLRGVQTDEQRLVEIEFLPQEAVYVFEELVANLNCCFERDELRGAGSREGGASSPFAIEGCR